MSTKDLPNAAGAWTVAKEEFLEDCHSNSDMAEYSLVDNDGNL